MFNDDDDRRVYLVVINEEEQYSVWLADREPPTGWRAVGFSGSRDECLDHIEQVWTDMRPLSLRTALAEAAGRVTD
ncbi:MbtH family protein [Micromonospora sp. NPDC049051]|uniref:MbtH family protein n=1 Tax=unclassified Micromonospora TaxID=2617518 RepID=UPI00372275CC